MTRFIFLIGIPATLFVVAGYFFQINAIPDERTLSLNTKNGSAKLSRDLNGVVFIEANSDEDAHFALGYAHAQDRLWQLTILRATARGELSEILGKEYVNLDIWFRTLGLHRAAASAWQNLNPSSKTALSAYTRGINQSLQKVQELPLEFQLLGIEPKPWQQADSLSVLKMFAFSLAGNLTQELERYVGAQLLSKKQMLELFDTPSEPLAGLISGQSPVDGQNSVLNLLKLQQQVEQVLGIGNQFAGSNAWVVSGKINQNGQVILANDPHLNLQIPSPWYVAQIRGEQLDVTGMTLVGVPAVIFGHNRHIAWGGTNMAADVQDIFIEQVNPNDASQYKTKGRWQEFATSDEYINIKVDFPEQINNQPAPLKIQLRHTDNGPVINDQFNSLNQVATLKWVGFDKEDHSLDAFIEVNYATDWQSFNDAMSKLKAPALNMVYGDNQGNIGYLAAGKIPVRNNLNQGRYPVSATDNKNLWSGYIPFDALPRQYNPPQGYVSSANNKMTDNDYPYTITHDWAQPTRFERINQLIEQKQNFDVETMRLMQADTLNLSAVALLKHLDSITTNDPEQQNALSLLKNWDGDMSADSAAPALFVSWASQLKHQLLDDELSLSWNKRGSSNVMSTFIDKLSLDKLNSLLSYHPHWCDKTNTKVLEQCPQLVKDALFDAVNEMKKYQQDDWQQLRWNDLLKAHYRHTPFSENKLMSGLFAREVNSTGATDTLNVANATFNGSKGYLQNFGASFRHVVAFDKDDIQYHYMNSTGQSGNPLSDHFDDMLTPFNRVELYRLQSSNVNPSEGTSKP